MTTTVTARHIDWDKYSNWCPQGFVASAADLPPVNTLCRIIERATGRIVAYVPMREDDKEVRMGRQSITTETVARICDAGGGPSLLAHPND
jgi:hypothetical protein